MLQVSISYTSKHAPQLLNKQGWKDLFLGGGVSPRNIFLSILTCATSQRIMY
jgi:hypothetical protein